jgi:hypothetical protein
VRRLRSALVLAALAVLVVGVAVLAVADPFHLRHIRWFTAGSVLLAVLLATAAFAVLAPRGLLRAVVLVLGVVAALGWVGIVAAATHVSVESRSVSEVTDGDRRLVVVEATSALDPVYAVVVRSGGGAFEQETVVYQGVESAPPPASVRFVDSDTVEVLTGGGCTYRSEVEAVTLAADPVHRPLHAETC